MELNTVKTNLESEIQNVQSLPVLEELRAKYLGRKGIIAGLTASIPGLPGEQRAAFGKEVNALKEQIVLIFQEKQKSFNPCQASDSASLRIDLGMPGIVQELGRLHPLTQIIDQICDCFVRMGFSVVEGPEIENEYNNFTGLNIPLDHPSRDAFDTFYLLTRYPVNPLACSTGKQANRQTGKLLLRSHTSPVQVRVMKASKPPLAVVVPGRVYRPDATDASHSFMFHQIEGFIVGENIRFSDLKGILEIFLKNIFGSGIKMRFRPHFFPFTEPSAEVDISCIICGGEPRTENREPRKCSVCGGKGWLEVLGSGMIHPNVFKHVGYDAKKYSGLAFGMGVERIAMLKYGIDDIRLFFENDLRFLKQF